MFGIPSAPLLPRERGRVYCGPLMGGQGRTAAAIEADAGRTVILVVFVALAVWIVAAAWLALRILS